MTKMQSRKASWVQCSAMRLMCAYGESAASNFRTKEEGLRKGKLAQGYAQAACTLLEAGATAEPVHMHLATCAIAHLQLIDHSLTKPYQQTFATLLRALLARGVQPTYRLTKEDAAKPEASKLFGEGETALTVLIRFFSFLHREGAVDESENVGRFPDNARAHPCFDDELEDLTVEVVQHCTADTATSMLDDFMVPHVFNGRLVHVANQYGMTRLEAAIQAKLQEGQAAAQGHGQASSAAGAGSSGPA